MLGPGLLPIDSGRNPLGGRRRSGGLCAGALLRIFALLGQWHLYKMINICFYGGHGLILGACGGGGGDGDGGGGGAARTRAQVAAVGLREQCISIV